MSFRRHTVGLALAGLLAFTGAAVPAVGDDAKLLVRHAIQRGSGDEGEVQLVQRWGRRGWRRGWGRRGWGGYYRPYYGGYYRPYYRPYYQPYYSPYYYGGYYRPYYGGYPYGYGYSYGYPGWGVSVWW